MEFLEFQRPAINQSGILIGFNCDSSFALIEYVSFYVFDGRFVLCGFFLAIY